MNLFKDKPLFTSLFLITFYYFLAYFPFIPYLGFYSDDFFFGYIGHFYGLPGIIKSLIVDRPFDGYLLILNYLILGDNVLLWHIYIFLMRLLGGYLLFLSLHKLWPNRLSIITSITLLFLIYPGYLQQPLPLGYGSLLITLTLWISSLLFTLIAVKSKNRFNLILFTLLALVLQILSFLVKEFFIGMEFLRFLLIIYIFTGTKKITFIIKKAKSYWKYYIPYIFSTAIFILWRILIFKSTRQETDINWVAQTYYSNPIWILKLPLELLYSFISTLVLSYFIPIIVNILRLPITTSITLIITGILSGVIIYFYFKKIDKTRDIKDLKKNKDLAKKLLIMGTLSIVGALIPIIISGRYVRMYYVLDRYTITSIIGVGFILLGAAHYKFSYNFRKIFLTFLIALSVTSNLMNGAFHKINWDKQKVIWWQLIWRSPQIKENTMLIFAFPKVTDEIPFNNIINKVKWYRFYWVDYQLWAPGNLFFNYNNPPIDHFRGDFLEDKNIDLKIKTKVIENIEDRNIKYTKDFGKVVIVSTPGDKSCLWALDRERDEFPNNSADLLKSSISYSDTNNLVKSDYSATPPEIIFGKEPIHDWCYYFEKASLARQLKEWDKLSQLTNDVLNTNLRPKDPNEWLPFIEGLIISKNYSQAKNLIKTASISEKNQQVFKTNICMMLKRLQTAEINVNCQL